MTAHDTSLLGLGVEQSLPGVISMANDYEIEPVRTPEGVRVVSAIGTVDVAAAGDGTRITLTSPDGAHLQTLRDLVTERLSESGVALVWERAGTGLPANMSLARVAGVERISPAFVRVSIEGENLARFGDGGFHFRLLFGPEGADWPHLDEAGTTHWPGGAGAWHRPVYTTRRLERLGGKAARMAFDVFQHDGGRTAEWTKGLHPGTEIAITGPGGSDAPPPVAWIGMVGDETAVPVVARMLAACGPQTRGEAVLFVPDRADIQELTHPPGISVRWECRNDGIRTPLDALEEMQIPQGDRHVFFAAERGETLAARRMLIEAGLGKKEFVAIAYWSRDAEH